MAIRLSGINSGLDTDAIVQELVSAYSLKTEKYQKEQTKIEWKQEAWKSLNTKIYSLYTSASNMRFDSAYNMKKTSVSNGNIASVTASSSAVTGTQKLNVYQTAQAAYLTGGKLGTDGQDVTAETKLSELGYTWGDTTIKVEKNDGTTHEIKISKATTIKDVVDGLKEAGLNASFDENNGRIFVNAKESGAENGFNIVSDNSVAGIQALDVLGLSTDLVDEEGNFINGATKYQTAYDLYKAAATAGKTVEEYIKAQLQECEDALTAIEGQQKIKTDYENLQKQYEDLEAQQAARSALEDMKTTVNGNISYAQLEYMIDELQGKETIDKAAVEECIAKYNGANPDAQIPALTDDEINGIIEAFTSEDNKEKMATVAAYKGADISSDDARTADALTEEMETVSQSLAEGETAYDAVSDNITEQDAILAGLKASMDSLGIGSLVEGNKTETEIANAIKSLVSEANSANNLMNKYEDKEGAAVKIDAQDAKIKLNGVVYTSSTNNFSINGLNIEATGVTNEEGVDDEKNAITITTSVDTQGIYDKIKDFLTEYNNVINEITKLYNAESASDYEPLTDEEKDAMSEEQIEKWENKIKSALLRRDSSLGGIMNAMVNTMAQTIEIGGQKLSLSSFGIQTMGFLNAAQNEHYAYHIDGDEDDENTSGKEDKLMKAIQEDPEQICAFMKQLTSNLYDAIHNKMKSTELSSAYKVYNDKELDSQLTKYKQLISDWEDKVSEQEEYYYDKFSQMEVALSKLQNQTSALSGLIG